MENKIYIACEYEQESNFFEVTAISNMSTYDINQEAILDDTTFDFSKIEGYIGYTHTDGNLHVKFDQSTYDAYLQEQQEKEALKKPRKRSRTRLIDWLKVRQRSMKHLTLSKKHCRMKRRPNISRFSTHGRPGRNIQPTNVSYMMASFTRCCSHTPHRKTGHRIKLLHCLQRY